MKRNYQYTGKILALLHDWTILLFSLVNSACLASDITQNTSTSVRVELRFQAYFIYFRIDISISILLKGPVFYTP